VFLYGKKHSDSLRDKVLECSNWDRSHISDKKEIHLDERKFPEKIRIDLALISPHGTTQALQQADFFNYVITFKDILSVL
jgi:hypothetical protein